MSSATWWVPGVPVPKGSLRRKPGSLALIPDNDAALKPWMTSLIVLSRQRARNLAIHHQEPVAVDLEFHVPRPPSVRRRLPAVKPDLDKLERAVLDALTLAGVLVDDGQVCNLTASKHYSGGVTSAGVRITVRVMDIGVSDG